MFFSAQTFLWRNNLNTPGGRGRVTVTLGFKRAGGPAWSSWSSAPHSKGARNTVPNSQRIMCHKTCGEVTAFCPPLPGILLTRTGDATRMSAGSSSELRLHPLTLKLKRSLQWLSHRSPLQLDITLNVTPGCNERRRSEEWLLGAIKTNQITAPLHCDRTVNAEGHVRQHSH